MALTQTEEGLQHAVMQFLSWALPPDAIANHAPGEGHRSRAAQRRLKRSGYRAGWPDVEIIWRGRAYFIELKIPGGSLSTAQRDTHKRLLYAGAEVMLARSVEQVEAMLREVGMPIKARLLEMTY